MNKNWTTSQTAIDFGKFWIIKLQNFDIVILNFVFDDFQTFVKPFWYEQNFFPRSLNVNNVGGLLWFRKDIKLINYISKIDSFFWGRSVFNQSLTSGTKRNLYWLFANFLTPEANLRPCWSSEKTIVPGFKSVQLDLKWSSSDFQKKTFFPFSAHNIYLLISIGARTFWKFPSEPTSITWTGNPNDSRRKFAPSGVVRFECPTKNSLPVNKTSPPSQKAFWF